MSGDTADLDVTCTADTARIVVQNVTVDAALNLLAANFGDADFLF